MYRFGASNFMFIDAAHSSFEEPTGMQHNQFECFTIYQVISSFWDHVLSSDP